MVRKVVTIDVEDEMLTGSAQKSSKAKGVKNIKALQSEQTEVERLGVMNINNSGALKKIRASANTGVVKNENQCSKRKIKTELSHVEDYFDFSFRPDVKCEISAKPEVVETVKVEKKPASAPKTKTSTTTQASVKTKTTSQPSKKVIAELKTAADEIINESCESAHLDDQASHNVWIARMSAMFDCDARMIKS